MSFAGALLSVYLVLALGTKKMGMESSTILLTGSSSMLFSRL